MGGQQNDDPLLAANQLAVLRRRVRPRGARLARQDAVALQPAQVLLVAAAAQVDVQAILALQVQVTQVTLEKNTRVISPREKRRAKLRRFPNKLLPCTG